MSDLDALEAEVLRKLEMLSEGATLNLDPNRVHSSRAGSSPPPGTKEDDTGVLSVAVSLMGYHKELMSHARERGISARLMAIARAYADYDASVKRPPTFNSFDSDQNTVDRDAAILVHFEGRRPEWPAAYMDCSASHVEKLRRRSGRDARTGERLEARSIGLGGDK
jgi:hypothetical protein